MSSRRSALFAFLCVGVVIIATGVVTQSSAGDRAEIVLFSSAEVEASTGIKVTQFFVADDFFVSTNAAATSASFVLGDWNGSFPVVFDGLIRWEVRLDTSGSPGSLVEQGTAYDISYMPIEPPGGSVYTTTYFVSFNFGQMVELSAGVHYWLVLNVNHGFATDEFFSWVKAESVYSDLARYRADGANWTQAAIDLTFSILASTEVDYLFADGFESGDSNIWSEAVP